jgi:hypothetical protein
MARLNLKSKIKRLETKRIVNLNGFKNVIKNYSRQIGILSKYHVFFRFFKKII